MRFKVGDTVRLMYPDLEKERLDQIDREYGLKYCKNQIFNVFRIHDETEYDEETQEPVSTHDYYISVEPEDISWIREECFELHKPSIKLKLKEVRI